MSRENRINEFIRAESVLVDRGAVGELYETALKFVGIGVGGILYSAGKKGGARGAHLLHKQFGLEGDALLDAAISAFNESNWGRATLQRNGGTLHVEVQNSALACSVKEQQRHVCHPLAGYISGFLEVAWKRPVKVREIECLAHGDLRCVFEVE